MKTYTASHLCRKSIVRQIYLSARSIRSFQIESTTVVVIFEIIIQVLFLAFYLIFKIE
jgi:hypothetical protein